MPGNGKSGFAYVGSGCVNSGAGMLERNGDAAGTGADVENMNGACGLSGRMVEGLGGKLAAGLSGDPAGACKPLEEVDRAFHKNFGIRFRDKDVGSYMKGKSPEFLDAGEIGYRHS